MTFEHCFFASDKAPISCMLWNMGLIEENQRKTPAVGFDEKFMSNALYVIAYQEFPEVWILKMLQTFLIENEAFLGKNIFVFLPSDLEINNMPSAVTFLAPHEIYIAAVQTIANIFSQKKHQGDAHGQ